MPGPAPPSDYVLRSNLTRPYESGPSRLSRNISGMTSAQVFKDLRKGDRDGGHAGQAPACG